MIQKREDVRNVAIIAHVDHGKTTLVDGLLHQSGVFRANQEVQERVMDSNALERERGITILSKNTAVYYKGVKINIIDTPGHADFGGEVERVLKMVNGVILVVDAFEGPMPQTRFVLSKAMALDLPVIVCINKIDRPGARPVEVIDEVLELLMDLGASDEQIDCPFVFASAKSGIATLDLGRVGSSMKPLFETIIDYIPAPEGDPEAETQVLISTIDYNEYIGRIGVGKVDNGCLKVNQEVVIVNHHDPDKKKKVKVSKLYEFEGLNRVEVQEARIGSIVAISGISDLHIGDMVYVEKGGEIIPKITGVDTDARGFMLGDKVKFISRCPECGTPLVRFEGEAAHYCPNDAACPPQIKGKIEHFISRKAMAIDGLGPETVDLFYQIGLVHNVADLYTLKALDIRGLDRMGDKSAIKIIHGIADSKQVPFERVLFALGIRFVGETAAKKLAKAFGNIEALEVATKEQLMAVDEIGEKIAQSVLTYFALPANRELITRLKEAGLQMERQEDEEGEQSDKLAGLSIVISGVFSHHSREEYKDMIEKHGGKNVGSISSKTSFILAGENMGPAKLEKAQKLGIKIINEDDFLQMLL